MECIRSPREGEHGFRNRVRSKRSSGLSREERPVRDRKLESPADFPSAFAADERQAERKGFLVFREPAAPPETFLLVAMRPASENLRHSSAVTHQRKNVMRCYGQRLACVPRILAFQNRRLGRPLGPEDLADVTQESLVVVWRKLDEFDPATRFESWVYRICFLELMNYVRKVQRRRRLLDEAKDHLAAEAHAPGTLTMTESERFESVHVALGVLSEEEAVVVRLHHFEEQTFEEVGERLGIPMGTAKTRYYRGLEKLRAFLRNHEQEGTL